jgi:hypothetical protein
MTTLWQIGPIGPLTNIGPLSNKGPLSSVSSVKQSASLLLTSTNKLNSMYSLINSHKTSVLKFFGHPIIHLKLSRNKILPVR